MEKHRDKASLLLDGLGRIAFRGLLQLLMYYEGMAEYWSRQGVPTVPLGSPILWAAKRFNGTLQARFADTMPMKSTERATLPLFPEAIMAGLSSGQRKFLRSKAHHLKPLVLVGKHGLTDTLVDSVNVNLEAHELIKVRFNEHKEEKREITDAIAERTESEIAGILGHVAILYRPRKDPEKRTIKLPAA